jgi:hypothetical protein
MKTTMLFVITSNNAHDQWPSFNAQAIHTQAKGTQAISRVDRHRLKPDTLYLDSPMEQLLEPFQFRP